MRKLVPLLLMLLLLTFPALADVTITLTFTGDITLGGEDLVRDTERGFSAVYRREGAEYFLKNMKDFFAEDDLTVVNLEGVLTDNMNLPQSQGIKIGKYFFRGEPELAEILSCASVEAVSLANNHTRDFGEQGLRDTIAAVEGAGLQWFGTYDWNRRDTERFLFYEKEGVTICLMSLYWEDYGQGDVKGNGEFFRQQIQTIKESGQADAVICVFHGGQEYDRHRSRPQTVFTNMAMKAGADLVICHHAHVVMGMDVIGNRSVFYSLGNFCFGGNVNAYQQTKKKTQDAAPALVVRAELTFSDDGTYLGQQMTLVPVQTTGVDREKNASTQANNYQPKFITGPLGAHVLHLLQVDMCYELKDQVNRELKNDVIAEEKKLDAMDSSEGMARIVLPYLPAE